MFNNGKAQLLNKYIDTLYHYDCRVCKSRKETIKCIPRPFLTRKTDYMVPLVIVTTFPKLADEETGYLCQTIERERISRWMQEANCTDTYITSVFKCPVRLDDFGMEISPTPKDVRRCSYLYLRKELEFIQPHVIVAFGERAIIGLIGCQPPEAVRYMFSQFTYQKYTIFGIYHPAAIDRGQADKEPRCIELLKEAYTLNRRLNNVRR